MLLAASAIQAQTPADPAFTLPYTGFLADASGRQVNDGLYDFIFTLYSSEKGENALWSEQQSGVSVKSGDLNVSLGQFTPLSKEMISIALILSLPVDRSSELCRPEATCSHIRSI